MGLIDFSLNDVGSIFKDIREAITGEAIKDPNKQAEVALKLAELEQAANSGQLKINEIEASHPSIFISGWRPFIGWVGGIALAYSFILMPIFVWIAKMNGIEVEPPRLDSKELFDIVMALLGIGTLRTYEKFKGVDTKQIKGK